MFEWWHWMVLGMCLAMGELAVPAFFIVWFGIGAIGVGLALLIAPEMSVATQVLLWAGLSSALVVFWFRYLKPRTMTAVGTSALDASVALLTACAMNVDKWDWSWNSVNECPAEKPAKAAKTAAKPAKAAAKKKKAK